MNSLRLRFLLPLMLFGFLPAIGAARLMGHPLEWFFGTEGVLLGGGVFLAGYLLSGWVLKPVAAVMNATASVLRGVPPSKEVAQWLPADFWKLRCDINMLFAKHRQSLNAAESHACQTAQRLLNAERLLREAFTALQGIFAASDEGVAVVDSQGTIIASNTKLDEFLGKPLEELGGRDSDTLLKAVASRFAESEQMTQWMKRCIQDSRATDRIEADLAGRDGRSFSIRTAPMQTDTGEVIGRLWMVRDCTQMRGLQQQLRESQKLGTLGQLAGGIAHDFNNMLTAIRGNLTLAELQPASNQSQVREKLQCANQATQRAADLVKSLLGYSRRSSGNSLRKVTNVKKLLAEVQTLLKHSVDPRVEIRMRAGMDASFVVSDPTQLEQVVLNLCLNARDALPEDHGIIEIGIENVTHRNPGGDGAPAEFAMIVVRDNGNGIPEESRGRIFEPFFTTKRDGKGTGLGLSMAQDIVREHGGWIEFDSVVGQGTEFRIFLPRTADPENVEDEPNYEQPQTVNTPVNIRGHVLVVDDEAPVRSIAVNMLTFLGYRVSEASDGQQALNIVLNGPDKVDVMLLDIYMPKLSGRDTFKQLRAAGNDIPVVVCSGFVIDPDEFVVLGEGRNPPVDIMLKPYSLDGLSKSMAKAIKTAHSPEDFAREMTPVMPA
ncbi:two-component system, cell cycle sensor histidine kinase and response regulator CckA [Prosthecobacter debontii]|uniref:histidine kinase n=1 Tax=Prosthecobacter debontii TaxID=48467 RepID=A0A1T4WRG4_9BACT|nr:PAS domain-containing sensor histidine kinase [Prosthecobacter debontii]SKA79697.1 two-component system, cell cycle sensor histidine kinase and response regulator CckA [Prosthecobacter debontii]